MTTSSTPDHPLSAARSGGYSPIADYALIGEGRSAALVSRQGSIDWLCWPRFDSRSTFGRLLDAERGGFFRIAPTAEFQSSRRYIPSTNVLETTFETEKGRMRLTDLMPALSEERKKARLHPLRQIIRRVECLEGEVEVEAEFAPRPDYARGRVQLESRGDYVVTSLHGPEVLQLRSDGPIAVNGESASARFRLRGGERRDFVLSYETHGPGVLAPVGDETTEEIEATIAFWRKWSSHLSYNGPYREQVLRSALVLKMLSYAPSGAIVAAPTTSLPEHLGGIRNWDYRYCWLRDASFTVGALYDCGFVTEGGAFVDWLLYATRLTQPRLQILYSVFGEANVPESTLDGLDGYRGSRPVRVGNGAHDQFQLDVYGEVLGAIEEYTDRGEALYRDTRRVAKWLADYVARHWTEPDNGIWEKRGGRQQHVHAKIMAWAALDSAERLVSKGRIRGDAARWKQLKTRIHDDVMAHGFDRKRNSFVAVYDKPDLDASLLYVSRVGFLEGTDPRLLGTIDAIRQELGHGDLIHRYRTDRVDDGLPAGEGAFLPCSFWLVEALAVGKRTDEALEIFEQLLRRANDVGLYSEEIDVSSGEMLGNFPQALTHIGLLNAALKLENPIARRGEASEAQQRGEGEGQKPHTPGK